MMNKKYSYLIIALLLSTSIISCSQSKNDKDACVFSNKGKLAIKLTGRRVPLVHDIFSVFRSGTYNDSLLIPILKYQDTVINGKDIEVRSGDYKYSGTITIYGKDVNVNLFINDTDAKKVIPETWNGKYKAIIK